MITNCHDQIILSESQTFQGAVYRYRVIKTPRENGNDYSIFISSEIGDSCDECFIFSISTDLEKAESICKYLAEESVSALHVQDIISDLLGEESSPKPLSEL